MGEKAIVITLIYYSFGKTFTKPQKDTMLVLGTGAEGTTRRLNPLPTALAEEKQQGTLTCH